MTKSTARKKQYIDKLLSNDYILSLFTKASIMLFGFVSLVFLNRYLGAELKGQYSTIINYVTIISAIMQLGLSLIYPHYKRKRIDKCNEIFISLAILQFIFYTIISIIIIAITKLNYVVCCVCIISTVSTLTTQFRYIYLVEDIKRNTFVVSVMSILNCILTIISFLFLKRSLTIALAIYIIKDISIIVLYIVRINFYRLFKKEYKKYYLEILAAGLLPMLSGLLIILNYKIDVIMLNAFSIDYKAIGIYSLGLSIAEYIWVIPDIFKDVVQKRTSANNSLDSVNFSLRCSSTFVILAYIVLLIVNKRLFILIFGEEYMEAYNITMIMFIGVYSMVYYKIIGKLFISDGKSRQYFFMLLIGVIINVITNAIIIPINGIYGATIASVASYGGTGLLFLLMYLNKYKVKPTDVILIKKSDINKIKNYLK